MHPIIAVIVLFLGYVVLSAPGTGGLILNMIGVLVMLGAIFLAFGWVASQVSKDYKADRDARLAPEKTQAAEKCRIAIEQHAPELLKKRRRLISDKGYGLVDKSKWDGEKSFFISQVLRPAARVDADMLDSNELGELIERCLDTQHRFSIHSMPSAPAVGNALEFEDYCAGILERAGWKVSTTKASGDQGADVIAKMNGLTVVVQCKQYTQPVGNAAVQEAYAAKAHYGAHDAVVVTNATYTKSATELAESTGVLLLHQDDLAELIYKL